MNKKPIFLAMLVVLLALSLAFVGCKNDADDGGGSPLEGTWSQADNTAIKFSGGNLQFTSNITSNNVNWTLAGTYTFSSPTLTITPPPRNGVVQNAVQGTAVINGIQLTISGFPYDLSINGSWTKQ